MHLLTVQSLRKMCPRSRQLTLVRHARLTRLRVGRLGRRLTTQLMLFGGWTWVAAISLVGFEAFEILFLSFALAPEFLPLAIIFLAITWFLRERLREVWSQFRIRIDRGRSFERKSNRLGAAVTARRTLLTKMARRRSRTD